MRQILNPAQTYSFEKIFELKLNPKELAQEFGYSFQRKYLKLPQSAQPFNFCHDTLSRITNILPYVDLASEQARWEFLLAPILSDLIYFTRADTQIGCYLKASDHLQGNLDYVLETKRKFIIVKARNGDLHFGMTQLIAELIALDHCLEENKQSEIIGAVTTGKSWEFAKVERSAKSVSQGLEHYLIPRNFDELMKTLLFTLL